MGYKTPTHFFASFSLPMSSKAAIKEIAVILDVDFFFAQENHVLVTHESAAAWEMHSQAGKVLTGQDLS